MPLHPVEKPPYSLEVPGYEKKPGETIPRRNAKYRDELQTKLAPEVSTVWELVQRSAKKYPNHRAMGARTIKKHHKEVKKVQKNIDGEIKDIDKTWHFFELSGYSYLTYKEYEDRVRQLGSGLRHIGFTDDSLLHFFATTRFVILRSLHPRLDMFTFSCSLNCSRLTRGLCLQHSLDVAVSCLRLPVHQDRDCIRYTW